MYTSFHLRGGVCGQYYTMYIIYNIMNISLALVINISLSPYNKPQYITTSLLLLYYVYFLGIYCLQSIFIFSYISLLSVVGENCAVRMRTRLFQCLLEQDIILCPS